MKRHVLIPLSLVSLLALSSAPVYAKKPGSEGAVPPKGLQKKVQRGGQLPPGWQKKLRKGAILEPEVVQHGKPVSSQLRVKLPVGDRGSIDIMLDGKVIRLHEKTREVLGVFEVRM